MICLRSNQTLSLLYRTRRGEIEHSPSDSGHNESFQKWYVVVRIRPYLCYIESEGGKSSALYQNPVTMSLSNTDMSSFELDLISAISNPKGGNRALSIRIRSQWAFPKMIASFELDLNSAISNPRGVNRSLSIGIRSQWVFPNLICLRSN